MAALQLCMLVVSSITEVRLRIFELFTCEFKSLREFLELLEDIRGEDFKIEYRSTNKFRFLGNGFTKRDINGEDLGYYLNAPVAKDA